MLLDLFLFDCLAWSIYPLYKTSITLHQPCGIHINLAVEPKGKAKSLQHHDNNNNVTT